MLTDSHLKMIDAIYELYNEAESFIKAAEKINQRVAVAAINEIRYASRRLADFYGLVAKGQKTSELETPEFFLFEVEQLCIRAKHDALDASLSFFSAFFEDIKTRTSIESICAVCPNFLEVLRLQDEVDQHIAKSRQERTKRQDIYRHIQANNFPILFAAFQNLRHSEEIINASFIAKKRKQASDSAVTILTIILALMAVLLGILALPWVVKYFGA